jgi:hypothetical protein
VSYIYTSPGRRIFHTDLNTSDSNLQRLFASFYCYGGDDVFHAKSKQPKLFVEACDSLEEFNRVTMDVLKKHPLAEYIAESSHKPIVCVWPQCAKQNKMC